MSSDVQFVIKQLIDALENFLHSGADSEGVNSGDPFDGEDPKDLAIESVEPGGDIHNAVSALQPFYGGKLPAPGARNPWLELQWVCRHETDLYKRQIEAHRHAGNLQDWAEQEKKKLLQSAKPKPTGMPRKEVAEKLKRLCDQGLPFTSQHRLAKDFGCSSGTINRAIQETPELHDWAQRPKALPKAQSLNEVVTDQKTQQRELDPSDDAAIREHLEREDLIPDDRAFFNGLSREDQLMYLHDPDKHELDEQVRVLNRKP